MICALGGLEYQESWIKKLLIIILEGITDLQIPIHDHLVAPKKCKSHTSWYVKLPDRLALPKTSFFLTLPIRAHG